jgi:predicted alpha/beta superfamily hydrolase
LAGYFRHPEIFGGALCLSPSFWFDHGAIFREIPAKRPKNARIYVDVGMKEGRLMYPMAHRMVEALEGLGMEEEQLMWRPDKKGKHHEKHWRRRLRKALCFMFRR